jgi:8-oxo-dGTP pyrophosphatase MutT (NUDIX family)
MRAKVNRKATSSLPDWRKSFPSAKVLRPSHLRRLLECEQVAAVCYRIHNRNTEFLLVRTGGGRWTFPKGGVEPGLTHAQAAALEAFEEAGVHGRMEESPFTRYTVNKRSKNDPPVHAYLCQVLRLVRPQEANRDRTWFSREKAKRVLGKGRPRADGFELARTVDRAELRIRESHAATPAPLSAQPKDAWRKVSLEPSARLGIENAMLKRSTAIQMAVNAYLRKVVRPRMLVGQLAQVPQLTEGGMATNSARQKVTAIDRPRLTGKARSI